MTTRVTISSTGPGYSDAIKLDKWPLLMRVSTKIGPLGEGTLLFLGKKTGDRKGIWS